MSSQITGPRHLAAVSPPSCPRPVLSFSFTNEAGTPDRLAGPPTKPVLCFVLLVAVLVAETARQPLRPVTVRPRLASRLPFPLGRRPSHVMPSPTQLATRPFSQPPPSLTATGVARRSVLLCRLVSTLGHKILAGSNLPRPPDPPDTSQLLPDLILRRLRAASKVDSFSPAPQVPLRHKG